MTNHDEVIEHLMEIRDRVSKIEGHLKNQNSKIFKNEKVCKENSEQIHKLDLKLARWGGIVVASVFVAELMIRAGIIL